MSRFSVFRFSSLPPAHHHLPRSFELLTQSAFHILDLADILTTNRISALHSVLDIQLLSFVPRTHLLGDNPSLVTTTLSHRINSHFLPPPLRIALASCSTGSVYLPALDVEEGGVSSSSPGTDPVVLSFNALVLVAPLSYRLSVRIASYPRTILVSRRY